MSNTTFLDTYLALRAASEAERKQRERERQALLNTMALAEAELAKPEYFGFLIERDRMGYLEALSQTKTTFRGINPHDPLNGIVANGGINPDFVMMLEKNFFKNNSKNLDRDELYLVRYEIEKNKMIEWLKQEFQAFLVDDDYLMKKFGISQGEIIQKLQSNEWVWGINMDRKRVSILDKKQYLEGLEKQQLLETLPPSFCIQKNVEQCRVDLHSIFEEQARIIMERQEIQNKKENSVVAKTMIATLVVIVIVVYFCLR